MHISTSSLIASVTFVTLLAVPPASLTAGQMPGASDRAAVERQLVANERAVNDALMKQDMAAFKKLVDPAGYSIDPSGLVSVGEFEKMIGNLKLTASNVTDPKVHWASDDTAIVTYVWTGKGTWMDHPVPEKMYASTVWTKRGDQWVAVFHQETAAMEMPH